MTGIEILNVKVSFEIPFYFTEKNLKNTIAFTKTQSRLSFKHENNSFFILGNKRNHFNITGLHFIPDKLYISKKFSEVCDKELNPEFILTFDSICAKLMVRPNIFRLINSDPETAEKLYLNNYVLKRHIYFCGLSLKHSTGNCSNIFKNGRVTCFGFKSLSEIINLKDFLLSL